MPDAAGAAPPRDEAADMLAAADLGSNSFHMIVARRGGQELSVVDRLREPVRLAASLDARKRLSSEGQARALECLSRFGQRLQTIPEGNVRVVGTNTLRSARNAPAFLRAAQQALGHPVDIISGIEEARLIYLGVAHSLADSRERLVVDIGGGSTELIFGQGFTPGHMDSLYMGCVSMTRRFFADGAIDDAAWDAALVAARQELEPLESAFRVQPSLEVVGASGTILAVHQVASAAGWIEHHITPDALRKLRKAMNKAGHVRALALEGVGQDRAPVFPGGVAVLSAIFDALGIERMSVSTGALREGVLYDLLGRIRDEDIRTRSVAWLEQRYHVDAAQAARIEQTALSCLVQVAAPWDLEDDDAERYLGWAARLHEIGLDIAHAHYHKHGAYIAENTDLFGFSRQGQQVVAALIRAHRRKFPEAVFGRLTEPWATRARRLAILLRLAVLLHRSRTPDALPPFSLLAGGKALHVSFPAGWLDAHPLTRADVKQEARYLRAVHFTLDAE